MATECDLNIIDSGLFLCDFENLECEVVTVLKELERDERMALAQCCDLPQFIYDALANDDCECVREAMTAPNQLDPFRSLGTLDSLH